MKPDGFVADLRRKPEVLGRLAATLAAGNPWAGVVPTRNRAGCPAGHGFLGLRGRCRRRADAGTWPRRGRPNWRPPGCFPTGAPGTLVVATSAGGGSVETLDALGRLPDGVSTVALTNTPGSAITQRCDAVVDLARRSGGTAGSPAAAISTPWRCCWRSSATSAGRVPAALAASVAAAATASAHLLDTEADWRPEIAELVAGAGRNPSRRTGAPVLLRPAGRPDASRGTAAARGRLRDRGLEPRRRLPDEDHRLPAARFRRFGVGAATRRVDRRCGAAPSSVSAVTSPGRELQPALSGRRRR